MAIEKISGTKIVCYSINPENGELIGIERGEHGYMKMKDSYSGKPITGKNAEKQKESLNRGLGITHEQEEAMLAGSMFGWTCPAAAAAWDI